MATWLQINSPNTNTSYTNVTVYGEISGSTAVISSVTGSLSGTSSYSILSETASYSENSLSSSFAITAAYALNNTSTTFPYTGAAEISGSLTVIGPVTSTTGYTGFLFGTSSWANNVISSSYAITASQAINSISASQSQNSISSSLAITASYSLNAVSSSYSISASQAQNAVTSSYVLNAVSSSFATTSSFAQNAISSSFSITASQAQNAVTASYVLNSISSSFASTASSADNITVRGTLTAQTIVVQTITSSIDIVTGSTQFGTLGSNTHTFTGSVRMTGSLSAVNAVITGSLFGTSSWSNNSVSSSQAQNAVTASYVFNSISSSYSLSSSQADNAVTASYAIIALSASFATSASRAITSSYSLNSLSSLVSISSSFSISSSQAQNAVTASYSLNTLSSSFAISASQAQNAVTASYILNAVSSSFSLTASYILNAVSASFSTSASRAVTSSYSLSALSSSFATSASQATTSSYSFVSISSSFATSASQAQNSVTASYILNAISSSVSLTSSRITGGSANYIPIWNTINSLSSSILYQSASNIGVDNINPLYKLHFAVGNGGIAMFQQDSKHAIVTNGTLAGTEYHYGPGTVYGFVYAHAAGLHVRSMDNVSLVLGTNNIERVRITGDGLTGYGTTSPTARLHISGAVSERLLLVSASSGPALFVSGNRSVGIGMTNPSVYGGHQTLHIGGAESGRGLIEFGRGSVNNGPLIYSNNDDSLAVYGNGGVNIGAKLDVIGNTIISGSLKISNNNYNLTIDSDGNGPTLSPGNRALTIYGQNDAGYIYASQFSNISRWGINTRTVQNNILTIDGSTVIGSGYAGIAGPTAGLAVSGSVGIGTTSPAYRLDIPYVDNTWSAQIARLRIGDFGGGVVIDPLDRYFTINSQGGAGYLYTEAGGGVGRWGFNTNQVQNAIVTINGSLNHQRAYNRRTTDYTLALSDAGKIIEMNSSIANTVTIPTNLSIPFPSGSFIDVIQEGSGQTSFVTSSGVTVRSIGGKLKIEGQYGVATLVKKGGDEWYLYGDIIV